MVFQLGAAVGLRGMEARDMSDPAAHDLLAPGIQQLGETALQRLLLSRRGKTGPLVRGRSATLPLRAAPHASGHAHARIPARRIHRLDDVRIATERGGRPRTLVRLHHRRGMMGVLFLLRPRVSGGGCRSHGNMQDVFLAHGCTSYRWVPQQCGRSRRKTPGPWLPACPSDRLPFMKAMVPT
ncbi:hypothetical protein D187_003450 [Cystobacter fuscus DSM 2262]|uniref:Uncharacterized protein n=1 Tax=Cystobacter fuscus (strain ATCC 25194 / DSM 2262 / NBRC 100088 / M29) TaxID=1242864 RepID=S9QR36_CYSF2|nr:hypothetical protein D187_003450 [Cystobacter fuscus DSM 2262]